MPSDQIVQADPVLPATVGSAKRLGRLALGSLGLNVVNVAASVSTSVLLARIMGVTDFGTYAFVVATVTLLTIPAIVGLDRLMIRDYGVFSTQGAYGLARGLLRRAEQMSFLAGLVIALACGAGIWVAQNREVSPEIVTLWIGLAALPFLAVARVVQGALIGLHHVVLGQFPELVFRPLVFVATCFAAYIVFRSLDAQLAAALYGTSIFAACVVTFALTRSLASARVRSAEPEYRTRLWVKAALSLALLSAASTFNSQIGVVLLGALSGSDPAGLYAVAQRGALIIAFPLAAVNMALAPTAAGLWAARDLPPLRRLVTISARGLLVISLPIAVILIVFGRQLLSTLFGSEFAEADASLSILAVGQFANALGGPAGTLLIMAGHERKATICTGLGGAANIVLGFILIPVTGTAGAAVAAAASLALSNALLAIVAWRVLGIDSTALGKTRVPTITSSP